MQSIGRIGRVNRDSFKRIMGVLLIGKCTFNNGRFSQPIHLNNFGFGLFMWRSIVGCCLFHH
jgi:hypothetical protein